MFSFPRSAARRLRLLARKAIAGRARGPAPPVQVIPAANGLTLAVALDEVAVALHVPNATPLKGSLLLPMSALEAVEGTHDEPVEVHRTAKDSVTLRWTERGIPRSQSFDLPDQTQRFELPPLPDTLAPVPAEFLHALHEAGRHTARGPLRFALHRVQVRGATGEINGTDSSFVYRHCGFALPFAEDLLVPAVTLFGLKELAGADEIRIGGTPTHLVIVAGLVTVFLALDREGHFPDVAGVIPKTPAPATLTLDPEDALFLLDLLPALPGNEDESRPVTLDLAAGPVGILRVKAEGSDEVVEVRLNRSPVTRGSLQVVIDRQYLQRMLTLGCRTIRVATPGRPVVAVGGPITLIAMPLDSAGIIPPTPLARVLSSCSQPESIPTRNAAMKTPEPSANGHGDAEAFDPLVEADALRNALSEAQNRLARLMTALRSKKREQKALTQVWSSLKSLNLGG